MQGYFARRKMTVNLKYIGNLNLPCGNPSTVLVLQTTTTTTTTTTKPLIPNKLG
jgi:hypothetical protein